MWHLSINEAPLHVIMWEIPIYTLLSCFAATSVEVLVCWLVADILQCCNTNACCQASKHLHPRSLCSHCPAVALRLCICVHRSTLIAIPSCLAGVIMIARPTPLFGAHGSSTGNVSAAGIGLGIFQVHAMPNQAAYGDANAMMQLIL